MSQQAQTTGSRRCAMWVTAALLSCTTGLCIVMVAAAASWLVSITCADCSCMLCDAVCVSGWSRILPVATFCCPCWLQCLTWCCTEQVYAFWRHKGSLKWRGNEVHNLWMHCNVIQLGAKTFLNNSKNDQLRVAVSVSRSSTHTVTPLVCFIYLLPRQSLW